MEMFEVRVYDHDKKLLRRSLIQAACWDAAQSEARNVFSRTDGAHKFIVD